ncbi:MAG: flagellar protein FliT [Bdellovibrionales bacterium]|nr:flagellar protein FliT [Bdellovibrionales bacterium]
MNKIIDLLTEKNTYLEKFYSLNETEVLNFMDSNFDGLERFYESRDAILNMIRIVDEKIEEFNKTDVSSAEKICDSDKKAVLEALAFKDEIVQRILAQDLQILSCIENEKSMIIKELRSTQVAKKAINGYKTGRGPKGKTIDGSY